MLQHGRDAATRQLAEVIFATQWVTIKIVTRRLAALHQPGFIRSWSVLVGLGRSWSVDWPCGETEYQHGDTPCWYCRIKQSGRDVDDERVMLNPDTSCTLMACRRSPLPSSGLNAS